MCYWLASNDLACRYPHTQLSLQLPNVNESLNPSSVFLFSIATDLLSGRRFILLMVEYRLCLGKRPQYLQLRIPESRAEKEVTPETGRVPLLLKVGNTGLEAPGFLNKFLCLFHKHLIIFVVCH